MPPSEAPIVKCRAADGVLPEHIGQAQPVFNLAKIAHPPGLGKSALPHQSLRAVLSEKILPSTPLFVTVLVEGRLGVI